MPDTQLLEVRDLGVVFRSRRRTVTAVDGVSLSIAAGEALGVVGESGSGKTTIGRAILGLVPADAGSIVVNGTDATHATRRQRRKLASQLQVIFQDPYASLNPALKVGVSLMETMPAGTPGRTANARMLDLLERVGLPASAAEQYPSRFSGGQRQRLAIARALMPNPKIVICDEAVSALDVSIQAQVLNLLSDLKRDLGVSYLFISHDLEVVRFISDRILVLYHGVVMEEGPADVVAGAPRHPYTRALVTAAPRLSRPGQQADGPGDAPPTPSPRLAVADGEQATGCRYAPRCPLALDVCRTERPPLFPAEDGGFVGCHRYPEFSAGLLSASSS